MNLMVRLLKQNYTCESDGMITKWIFTCESDNKTLRQNLVNLQNLNTRSLKLKISIATLW